MERECAECKCQFLLSSAGSPVTYCKGCRSIRLKDILEMIIPDGNGECVSMYFYNEQSAVDELQKWEANIRLDLHNTLDTVDPREILPTNSVNICCISYVGNITQTRTQARLDIINRIKSGQIKFGALVFKRGPHKDPQKVLFVDDSKDHVDSVCLLGHVKSILLQQHHNLRDILKGHPVP
jgi:hypothetical protein